IKAFQEPNNQSTKLHVIHCIDENGHTGVLFCPKYSFISSEMPVDTSNSELMRSSVGLQGTTFAEAGAVTMARATTGSPELGPGDGREAEIGGIGTLRNTAELEPVLAA